MSRNTDVQIGHFSYKIYIRGKLLDDERMKNILEVNVQDNCTGSDLLQISMCDPDSHFIADDIITEKSAIKFEATYTNSYGVQSTFKFEGYISIIDIDFKNDGVPVMTIHCMDNTFIMDSIPKKRTWEKTTRSEVVKKIFKEHGLKAVVDSTSEVVDTLTQSNETDIVFITKLASDEKEDYIVYVEGNTGYFKKKPTAVSSQATLRYKEAPYDILGFLPRISKKTSKTED